MIKIILAAGALFAMLAVALGAFGAHGLKSKISSDMLAVFQTGVQYQFYHALGLLLLGVLMRQTLAAGIAPSALLSWSGGLMIAGIVLFSGSLYLLALTGYKGFGPVTPLGGVCFIVAWALLLVFLLKD